MAISPYDFDTQFAPFEAFAPMAPLAPLALMGWFVAPAQWWVNACLGTCGALSDAMIRSMVYPSFTPIGAHEVPPHAKCDSE